MDTVLEDSYSETSDFALTILKKALEDYILTLFLRYSHDQEKIISILTDLKWLGTQRNIVAIWGDHKKLYKFLTQEDYEETRINFIVDTTMLLKARLGAKRWNLLMDNVLGCMRMHNNHADLSLSLISSTNLIKISPNKDLLEANHWMVPVILYGIMGDTVLAIDKFIMEMDLKKKRPNRVSRSN